MSQLLTCGDLADLGVEGCASHNPRAQLSTDRHCFCWQLGPAQREHGLTYGPEEFDEQGCGDMDSWTAADGTSYELCCRCLDEAGGRAAIERAVAAARAEEAAAPWQPSWADEALRAPITLLYDSEVRRPACVLLQVAAKCDHRRLRRLFPPETWLLAPTPGMKRVCGTLEEWQQLASRGRGEVPGSASDR